MVDWSHNSKSLNVKHRLKLGTLGWNNNTAARVLALYMVDLVLIPRIPYDLQNLPILIPERKAENKATQLCVAQKQTSKISEKLL